MPHINKLYLEPAFEILPESMIASQNDLICEVTDSGFSFFFTNIFEKKVFGLSVFYLEDAQKSPSEFLKHIFKSQTILNKNFNKIYISYSGEESILLPEELNEKVDHQSTLNTIYGDLTASTVLTDRIADRSIQNIFRVPTDIYNTLIDQFPLAILTHQYSVLIKQGIDVTNLMRLIFYNNKFVVVCIKDKKIPIIQTYSYAAPADVIYYLFNICKQFDVVTPHLQLEGMIEKDSIIYIELEKYFTDIQFAPVSKDYEIAEGIKNFPAHYFDHLLSLYL